MADPTHTGSHDWKPGDVTTIRGAYAIASGLEPTDWPEHPLVVIDPEDRESVKLLSDLLVSQGISLHGSYDATATNGGVQRALREFANPGGSND